jgi:hypothetical protein
VSLKDDSTAVGTTHSREDYALGEEIVLTSGQITRRDGKEERLSFSLNTTEGDEEDKHPSMTLLGPSKSMTRKMTLTITKTISDSTRKMFLWNLFLYRIRIFPLFLFQRRTCKVIP